MTGKDIIGVFRQERQEMGWKEEDTALATQIANEMKLTGEEREIFIKTLIIL